MPTEAAAFFVLAYRDMLPMAMSAWRHRGWRPPWAYPAAPPLPPSPVAAVGCTLHMRTPQRGPANLRMALTPTAPTQLPQHRSVATVMTPTPPCSTASGSTASGSCGMGHWLQRFSMKGMHYQWVHDLAYEQACAGRLPSRPYGWHLSMND